MRQDIVFLQKKEYIEQLKAFGKNIVIITDATVKSLYGDALEVSLKKDNRVLLCSFPGGEQYKTRQTKEVLEDMMFAQKFGKDTLLVALGGGVVTDIGGYIAATYCRGISHIMIPTTLLGMVDASIGGKTGVNTPAGKNLIGCIYQPKKVFIDFSTLSTLSKRNIQDGIAEMIKHALIASQTYFDYIETHVTQLLSLSKECLEYSVQESCRIKGEIVDEDEKDVGRRVCLNLGHTVAHTLEVLSCHKLSHGEAVSLGILIEGKMAEYLGLLPQKSLHRIRDVLRSFGLPTRLEYDIPTQAILEAMVLDKKSVQKKPRFVLLEEIGRPLSCGGAYCQQVEEFFIKDALEWIKK